jgi:LmbE family N-acetylglucosaminyl deacetylase
VVAESPVVSRVLVIAPHMDDEVLGCAGLIQRLRSQGFDTTVVFCTETDEDVRYVGGDYVVYANEKRSSEMEQVAEFLGFDYVQLGLPLHGLDGILTATLVSRLEEWLRDAELVVYPAISHDQDHEAVRTAISVLSRPHRYAGTLLGYATWGVPDYGADVLLVPLSPEETAAKVEALGLYFTQVRPGGVYDELYLYSPASVTHYLAAAGRLCHTEHAEAFRPRRIVPNPTTAALLA